LKESIAICKGMLKFGDEDNRWAQTLDFYRAVFDVNRTNVNLKDRCARVCVWVRRVRVCVWVRRVRVCVCGSGVCVCVGQA